MTSKYLAATILSTPAVDEKAAHVPRPALDFDPIAEARRQWAAHGWEQAALGMAAVTSVMRAQQILLARIDAVLRELDLTFARYEVLMLLHFSRAGALPLSVVGKRLQVHPASVTSAVDRLEAQDLVRREPHPTDRRTTLARLTDAGRTRAEEATARLNATVFADLGLPAEQQEVLVDALRQLREGEGDF
jgi:DNA-binding MarR family transcriptional regulator